MKKKFKVRVKKEFLLTTYIYKVQYAYYTIFPIYRTVPRYNTNLGMDKYFFNYDRERAIDFAKKLDSIEKVREYLKDYNSEKINIIINK